jgi:hypothetical protein
MTKPKGDDPKRGWTEEKEDIFFERLGATLNTRKSAKAAGMDERRVYDRRLHDTDFHDRYAANRAAAYLRVEERLILDCLGEADEEDPDRPMTQEQRELSLNLLKYHHGAAPRPHSGGTPPKRVSEAETDEAILARLAEIRRRLEKNGGGEGDG